MLLTSSDTECSAHWWQCVSPLRRWMQRHQQYWQVQWVSASPLWLSGTCWRAQRGPPEASTVQCSVVAATGYTVRVTEGGTVEVCRGCVSAGSMHRQGAIRPAAKYVLLSLGFLITGIRGQAETYAAAAAADMRTPHLQVVCGWANAGDCRMGVGRVGQGESDPGIGGARSAVRGIHDLGVAEAGQTIRYLTSEPPLRVCRGQLRMVVDTNTLSVHNLLRAIAPACSMRSCTAISSCACTPGRVEPNSMYAHQIS